MSKYLTRLISLILSFSLILEHGVFAQGLDLSRYLANSAKTVLRSDIFHPPHLRCISYSPQEDNFSLRLDKGSLSNPSHGELEDTSKTLFNYFLIGLSLPNDAFWVNLRPDSPDNIIDDSLARTDIGKIMLETDLQLKKDTAQSTSPQTPEGKAYWDKLYQKAEELYGSANITIPTLTRPWIVPGEIIIGETQDSAYIYKATLKVMLEEDYLSRGRSRTAPTPDFSDPRLKELNQYSTQLIKETIIPKLTKEVNTSQRYAPLRQVYYSLILAQWFKERFSKDRDGSSNVVTNIQEPSLQTNRPGIDSGNLTNLTSSRPYDKLAYFKQYQDSFAQGEYNLQEPRYTPSGQTIRSYFSGGEKLNIQIPPVGTPLRTGSPITIIPSKTLPSSSPTMTPWVDTAHPEAASSLIDMNLSPAETAKKLAEKLRLLPPDDLILEFTISGKDYKVWSNADRTLYMIGPLILLPLINKKLDKPKERLEEELDIKEENWGLDSIAQERINELETTLGKSYFKENPNVLLVPPFSAVPAQPINPYSALMIPEMLTTDFKGKTVIDAGSGAGLLALIALKLGAKRVIIIEKDEKERRLARTILEAQRYENGEHFVILDTDLNKTKKLKKELEALGISEEEVIGLANIGPWYGETNYNTIKLFIELGVIKIINGGYCFNFKTYKQNLAHIKEFNKIISLLKYANYNVEQYPHYNHRLPILTGYGLIFTILETTQPLTDEKQSMPTNPDEKKSASPATFGGIDFRSLPIVTQARSSLSANIAGSAIARLKDIDLSQEWLDIQNLTRSGIAPSAERIRGYLQGLCLKDDYLDEKAKNIILCLADILRLEEENYLATDALLKDILIILSSTDKVSELKETFLGKG